MSVQFNRTAITPVWLVVFGLLALLWSPMSAPMGVLLLMVGVAGPVMMLITSSKTSATLATAVPRAEGSQRAR